MHHSRVRIMQSMHMGPRTLVGHAHPTHGHPPRNSHTCTNLGPLVTRGQFGSRFRSILPNHPSLFDFRVGSLGRRSNPSCHLGLAPRRLTVFGDISPKSGLARYTTPPAVVRPRARPECGPPSSGGASEGACSLEGGPFGLPPPPLLRRSATPECLMRR